VPQLPTPRERRLALGLTLKEACRAVGSTDIAGLSCVERGIIARPALLAKVLVFYTEQERLRLQQLLQQYKSLDARVKKSAVAR
jgi:hypothetical protein